MRNKMSKAETKRKILAAALSVVMLLSLLPGVSFTASAAMAESVYLGGTRLPSGMYMASGNAEVLSIAPEQGGYAYFENGVLRLNDFRYDGSCLAYPGSSSYAALYSDGDLTITLTGDNVLKCGGYSYANGVLLAENANLTVNGSGSLYVGSVRPFTGNSSRIVITGDTEVVAHASGGGGGNGFSCSSFSFNGKRLSIISENGANWGRGIQADSIEFTGGATAITSNGIPLYGPVSISGADTVVACICTTSADTDTSTLVSGTMSLGDGLGIISPAGATVAKHPGFNGYWILQTAGGGYTRSFVVGPAAAAKSVMAGASHLKGAQVSNVYFGRYQQSLIGTTEPETGTEGVDWVYQHNENYSSMPDSYYNIDPIKWRVLFNTDGKLLMLSDTALDKLSYHNDDDEGVTYERSGIRSWLNGYDGLENDEYDYISGNSGTDYTSDNFMDAAFGVKEQAAIRQTEVINSAYEGIKELSVNPYHPGAGGGNDTNDKIFLLSLSDAMNPLHGFWHSLGAIGQRIAIVSDYTASGGTLAWIGTDTIGAASDAYYLRTPGESADLAAFIDYEGTVHADGGVVDSIIMDIRPALQLAPETIILTSAAVGGKNEAVGSLTELADYKGSDWKLTVYDESRSGFSAKFSQNGTKLNVTYSGAKTGDNEYISAIVKNESGQITHYGRLAQAAAASGTAELDISALDSVGSVYVFNEQINGDYETDYASRLTPFVAGEPDMISDSENEYNGYYQLENAENLLWFAQQVNLGNANIKGVMTADIDLSGIGWTPIGNATNKFSGIFDGQGYEITNFDMNITAKGDYGLFGYVDGGTVKDFYIDGTVAASITDNSATALNYGVIGNAANGAVISDIDSTVDFSLANTNTNNNDDRIGGIVGQINPGRADIERCTFGGTLDLGAANYNNAGGITAYVVWSETTIINCAFTGAITSSYATAKPIGGIIGYHNSPHITVTHNLSVGTITAADGSQSGLLFGSLKGYTAAESKIYNNYVVAGDTGAYGSFDNSGGTVNSANTYTTATAEQLASGEVAYKLGSAWGQTIGTEKYPVIGGAAVYQYGELYTNHPMNLTEFAILSCGANGTRINARLQIPQAGTYTTLFADYDADGSLNQLNKVTKAFEFGFTTVEAMEDIVLGVKDKIMLWSGDMTSLEPVCEVLVLSDKIQYVSCSGGYDKEFANNLFDGDVNTKWCSSFATPVGEPAVIFKYNFPACIESYTLTTANDTAPDLSRNWTAWTLYGSADGGEEWTEVHKVTNATLPAENFTESDPFVIENNTAKYQYYKLVVNSVTDGEAQQISEFTAVVR